MDSADSLLYLIEEIRTKVTGLEKAIDDIHHVKKSLKVASSDVKAQIRDSISRHLEALRNREIWLMSQVELIQQGKEEVLLQKQAEIIDMVGGLKKVCALLEQSVEEEKLGEVEVFEAQLNELLTAVEKMNISPEENPHISFKAHNLELLESIRGFGHIEGEAAADQSQLASLFNEINLTGVNSSPPSNKRKFFTPSGPMENWLLPGQKFQKSHSIPATAVSVEKWLNKCNPYSESEQEVASEMGGSVKSFDLSELKWTLAAEANRFPSGQDTFGGYFEEVKQSTLENWIKSCPKLPEQPKSVVIGESYSKIVAMGNENWLLYKQEKSNQRNFPENLGKIHKQEGSTLKWLRRSKSYEYLPQTSTGKAFTNIANTSMDQWLKPDMSSLRSEQPKCNSKSFCADCDCASTKDDSMDYSDTMSDADWLKIKEEDVISIENLDSIFRFKSKKSAKDDNDWLVTSSDKQPPNEEDRSGIKTYGQILQAQPMEDWVRSTRMTNKGKESVQDISGIKKYGQILQAQPMEDWVRSTVMSSKGKENVQDISGIKKYGQILQAQPMEDWVHSTRMTNKGKENAQDISGIKTYGQMLQAQPTEDWLCSTRLTNKGKENVQPNFMLGFLETLPSDYNKWLSTPTNKSLSADTCKWLARSSLDRCKNCPKMCSKGLFTLFDDIKDASDDSWLKQ